MLGVTGTQWALAVGGIAEYVGVGLTTLDIWWDSARETWRTCVAWARRDLRRLRRAIRRMLRRPVVETVSSSARMSFEAGGSARGIRSVPADAPLDEQLRMLRDLTRYHDERLGDVEEQIHRLHEQASRNLEALRGEMVDSTASLIAAAEGRYRGWRLLGILLTVTGATIVLVASVDASGDGSPQPSPSPPIVTMSP